MSVSMYTITSYQKHYYCCVFFSLLELNIEVFLIFHCILGIVVIYATFLGNQHLFHLCNVFDIKYLTLTNSAHPIFSDHMRQDPNMDSQQQLSTLFQYRNLSNPRYDMIFQKGTEICLYMGRIPICTVNMFRTSAVNMQNKVI